MSVKEIEQLFTTAGGVFYTPMDDLAVKLQSVTAFIFDWDGVFNDGRKGTMSSSGFTETDSMGVNLLRFSYWKDRGTLPFTAIITGEENPDSKKFVEREHFNALFRKVKDKGKILSQLREEQKLDTKNIAYFYDDVLDLAIAKECGISICIKTNASLLLKEYITKNSLCDFRTANTAGMNGVREACELLIGMRGNYDDILQERIEYSEVYQKYFAERQNVETSISEGG